MDAPDLLSAPSRLPHLQPPPFLSSTSFSSAFTRRVPDRHQYHLVETQKGKLADDRLSQPPHSPPLPSLSVSVEPLSVPRAPLRRILFSLQRPSPKTTFPSRLYPSTSPHSFKLSKNGHTPLASNSLARPPPLLALRLLELELGWRRHQASTSTPPHLARGRVLLQAWIAGLLALRKVEGKVKG